jgi:hypothetical protein
LQTIKLRTPHAAPNANRLLTAVRLPLAASFSVQSRQLHQLSPLGNLTFDEIGEF